MSPNITDHLAPGKVARITGGFYLAYILASVLATMLGQIGLGTAQQVYQAIVTNEGSFRLGLVIALISGFLFLMAAWGLYVLLRPVNKDLALLFLLLNTVGVAIQGASMLGNPPNKRFNLTRRRFAQGPPRLKRVFRKRN